MRTRALRLVTVLVASALSLAACSSGGSASSGSTTSPGQPRPAELIAMLRPGISTKTAGGIATGAAVRMDGVTGSDWNYSNPTEVFFYFAGSSTITQLDAVRHKLLGTTGVESVEIKLGS